MLSKKELMQAHEQIVVEAFQETGKPPRPFIHMLKHETHELIFKDFTFENQTQKRNLIQNTRNFCKLNKIDMVFMVLDITVTMSDRPSECKDAVCIVCEALGEPPVLWKAFYEGDKLSPFDKSQWNRVSGEMTIFDEQGVMIH